MCDCGKDRNTLEKVTYMAEKFEEVMEEDVDVYEESEEEYNFTPVKLDESKYYVEVINGRKIYKLKR